MQVLLVDDDRLCVEGIYCSVDWSELGIEEVYMAYSMAQAQEIFRTKEVSIILCDVEMPRGSGLDLLRWVKEEGYQPVSVLLTSYATFQYAKQAIELGVMDYLTKPADPEALEKMFLRAVDKVMEEQEQKHYQELASYWNANERRRIHRFWREVLEQQIMPDSEAIREQARKEHLVFQEENRYLPILFQIHGNSSVTSWQDPEETLQKEMNRLVFENWDQVVVAYNDNFLLTIVEYADEFAKHREKLEQNCRLYRKECQSRFQVSLSCYLGKFLESGDLAAQYQRLLEMGRDNVTERSGVFKVEEERPNLSYQRPPLENWMESFENGKYGKTVENLKKFLEQSAHERKINRAILGQLFQDFLQAFYVAADRKGLQAHLLFQDEVSMKLYRKATDSVREFLECAEHIIEKTASHAELADNTDSVVKQVERYIEEHLGEDLSRNGLAEMVCLSPDYLTRMFRQEKEMSLSEYITLRRMKEAGRLLLTTDLSVGDIAWQVGYENAAYFTKVFREKHGVTPAKFRNQK